MRSWRDAILQEFSPKVSRLTLVADPDGLLLEEGILQGIRERGFEFIAFEDPIAFRYAYESKFRSNWDRGEDTDLVVVLRSSAGDLEGLPYDLLQAGRQLSFNLGDIFPQLSYPVISALDRADLEPLYLAQTQLLPGQLGDNATKDFILRHVFEIGSEFVKNTSDLLRILLRIHYRGLKLPTIFNARFIQLLEQSSLFTEWPLQILVPDKEIFFAFLQERWPIFLDRLSIKDGIFEEKNPSNLLAIEGPVELPFEHQDVRIFMNDLFLEGLLNGVIHVNAEAFSKTWVAVGLANNSTDAKSERFRNLLQATSEAIPVEEARHGDWIHFARNWAELSVLHYGLDDGAEPQGKNALEELRTRSDEAFVKWLSKRYSGLANLPASPPVMLHHIPRYISRIREDAPSSKTALLVLDGLSLEQWIVIREVLSKRQPRLRFRENAVFAWVPTLTSISRQAIFAGKAPFFFPESLFSTDKEPILWKQFWADHGLSNLEVGYAKGLGDGDPKEIGELLSDHRIKVVGLVVDKVDKIMHGMELGMAGMHNQVRQWARQPYLGGLIDILLEKGFSILLTSDHGNIEASGFGRPSEGVLADIKGERVRTYSDKVLRNKTMVRFPSAISWDSFGLPENCFALLAPGQKAFIREGDRIVGHGGISLEELIVPFIQIERMN